jgi:predicted DNA-binding transcriptional regulator AlpA
MAAGPKRDAKCVSAEEAFRHLGIDRTTGYRAIKDGTFPLPIIHVGRLLKVPTAALQRLLDPDHAYDVDTDVHGPAA